MIDEQENETTIKTDSCIENKTNKIIVTEIDIII